MIRNERQYRVTLSQRDRLAGELSRLAESDAPTWVADASRHAITAQLMSMDSELADYVALREGVLGSAAEVSNLAELPQALIRARIAAKMTQRDLASRLKLSEQQVQRYEATDYAGASIARLQDVMQALGVTFRGELTLPAAAGSGALLRRALQELGLSRQTLSRRFFGVAGAPDVGALNAAARVARVFRADVSDVLAGRIPLAVSGAAFRSSSVANREQLNGYARYAEYLAELITNACTVPYRPLPDLDELRSDLGGELAQRPLPALLRVCWEHGIPVLPLSDPGAFYGACWWIGDRPAIALKHAMRSPDRWAFLLAHEMAHTYNSDQEPVLESDLDVREWRDLPSERAADEFASSLLLGDSAEAMVHVAVDAAGGDVARLKSVLPAVAAAGNVSVGLLADHVAARIGSQDINWWPTANRLHPTDEDAWLIARSTLFEYTDFSRLESLDRDIIVDGIGL